MIPLYAVGVFTSITLSQAGMGVPRRQTVSPAGGGGGGRQAALGR